MPIIRSKANRISQNKYPHKWQYNAPLPPTPNEIKGEFGKKISDDIRKILLNNNEGVEVGKEDNIFAADVDQIGPGIRKKLFVHLSDIIRDDFFGKFLPEQPVIWNKLRSSRQGVMTTCSNKANDIAKNTGYSYEAIEQEIILSDNDIKRFLTKEKHMQTLILHANAIYIANKDLIDKNGKSFIDKNSKSFIDTDYETNFTDEFVNAYEVANMNAIGMAINKFEKEGKIITTLDSDLYADIIKLSDKYSIRLGDGKFFVASDNIKITFRDPSETPSWATWFMEAVPLANIPDRATLFFMPPEEREKHFPKQLEDNPIICHASLWRLGEQTGILLHTSWCHIAASYRWKIDKPFEIASIMFRTASHPAHIARNFGYAPQLVVPGSEWF
jgi:hypothetical protein